MKRLIAMAFCGGIILGSGGNVDLPVTVLPSLGFIFVAYVGLAAWDLRDVMLDFVAHRLVRTAPAPIVSTSTRPVNTIGAPTPV